MTTSPLLPLTAADLPPLAPELVLIGSAFALMILDLFVSNRNKIVTHLFRCAGRGAVHAGHRRGRAGEVFHGMFVRDTAADVMKTGIVLLSGLTLVYGWRYLRDRDLFQGEIPVLILFGTADDDPGLGRQPADGLPGLELLALCSYALVASNRESGLASEAAMKYIVLGSLASGLLLYGMSLIYGATGSLHLDVIREAIPHSEERAADHRCGVHDRRRRLQAGCRAVPHVAAGRVPGCPGTDRTVHQLGAEAGRVRHGLPPAGNGRGSAVDRTAAADRRPGRGIAGHRQPDGHRAEQPQAHAGVLHRLAHRLPADGHRRWRFAGLRRRAVLRTGLRDHVHRRLRRDHRAVACRL